jgi:tetratricopeptide (TPR) repeat protein
MSPEQAMAKHGLVDHRTDVYSLGVTLYELLTGKPAVEGKDREEILNAITLEEPRQPRALDATIPRDLETIVLKAIGKEPSERYATAQEIADDLRRYTTHEWIHARRPSLFQRVWRWRRRHRSAATAAAVCLLVTLSISLGSIGWVLGDRSSRKRQAEAMVQEAFEAAKPGLEQGNPWDHALVSALRQTEAQLQSGLLSPELQQRVERLQKDVKMLAELERIWLGSARVRDEAFDSSDLAEELEKAFQAYGIDVARLEPMEAVGLLKSSAIRDHLVAGLYRWSIGLYERPVALSHERETDRHDETGMIRELADEVASPWVKQFVKGAMSADPNKFEKALLDAPIAELGPAMINLISDRLFARFDQASRTGAAPSENRASLRSVELLRRAQAINPADFWTNHALAFGLTKVQPPRLEEALGLYRASVALRPESPGARLNLGKALHYLGRHDEAITAYQKAIELKPDYAGAHINLGVTLYEKGLLDQAVAECQKAIRLNKVYEEAHYNLGYILQDQGKLDEAEAAYRRVIQLKPDHAKAHCNLGQVLLAQGRLEESLHEIKRGHELGSKRHDWQYPSADWVRQAERRLELDARLPKVLSGELQPADVAERLELAQMCQLYKGLYLAAYRFYRNALTEEPSLAGDLQHGYRYDAACAAALAGCRQGKDANQTDDKERASLRHQALDWLRADLTAWRGLFEKEPDKVRPLVLQKMQHWLQDKDFTGVRGPKALAKLPNAELLEWQKLWEEVETLRKQAAGMVGNTPAAPELVPAPKAIDGN